jgi:hypothetical protein
VLLKRDHERFRVRRVVRRVLLSNYVVFGILLQLGLGWRRFRAEFGAVVGLLVLFNAIGVAGILQGRRKARGTARSATRR